MSTIGSPLNTTSLVTTAMKLPGIKISREEFLNKEFKNRYPVATIRKAIDMNPAAAGIPREEIEELAKESIKYETSKVSAISVAAGIPGGFALLGTIPADTAQFFGFILRITQKLAYLYGFDEFRLKEDEIDDSTLNEIMIFLGIMFGVNEANSAVIKLAESVAKRILDKLPQKALTKGVVYPIVKTFAQKLGQNMTKEIFAKSLSKAVPFIGGVANGGMTYVSFRICSNRLKKKFSELPISDPNYYKSLWDESDSIIDFTDLENVDVQSE